MIIAVAIIALAAGFALGLAVSRRNSNLDTETAEAIDRLTSELSRVLSEGNNDSSGVQKQNFEDLCETIRNLRI